MRFVVDAQLPPALARHLIRMGHVAEHVADLDMLSATDQEIWAFAKRSRAVIVSKDEDFAILSARDRKGPQVVWVRMGNAATRDLLARLERVWDAVEEALKAGERLVEVVCPPERLFCGLLMASWRAISMLFPFGGEILVAKLYAPA